MSFKTVLPVILLGTSWSCSPRGESSLSEAWDARNRPQLMMKGADDIMIFEALPLTGALPSQPWSDTYWPSFTGGIAMRWNEGRLDQFDFEPPSMDSLSQASITDLAKLSPAEKYDLYLGATDFPLFRMERSRVSTGAEPWEGLCHGWAPASLLFQEPKPILAKGPTGKVIPFGSSDIKALLTLAQGNDNNSQVHFLGGRCNVELGNDPDAAQRPECRDVNAGAFHLVLANYLGLKKQGFVMDVTRGLQVWNQPVYQFSAKVEGFQTPSPGAAPGTEKEVIITAEVSYGMESLALWDAVSEAGGNVVSTKTYKYVLELDTKGAIIGGEWLQDDRPDFLWAKEKMEFTGLFGPLKELYQASIATQEAFPNPMAASDLANAGLPTLEPTLTDGVATGPIPVHEPR